MILASLLLTIITPIQSNDAKAILDKVVATYSKFASYQDTGEVVTKFDDFTTRKPFKTWFVRPSKWRFEFSEERNGRSDRFVAWTSGKGAFICWTVDDWKPKREEDISLALAGATGISGGSAHMVPNLLDSKTIEGSSISQLANPKKLEDGKIGKSVCYRIQGTDYGDGKMTLWIEKTKFLLLKIEEVETLPGIGGVTSVTTYTPTINPKIDPSIFNFKPSPK